MASEAALLKEEPTTETTVTAVPVNVTVLGENLVRLSEGPGFPPNVGFNPTTGQISLPVGSYQLTYTIVTPGGASYKNPAVTIDFDGGAISFPPRNSTMLVFDLTNSLTGTVPQAHDYTLFVNNALGIGEAHDPVILFEPPG